MTLLVKKCKNQSWSINQKSLLYIFLAYNDNQSVSSYTAIHSSQLDGEFLVLPINPDGNSNTKSHFLMVTSYKFSLYYILDHILDTSLINNKSTLLPNSLKVKMQGANFYLIILILGARFGKSISRLIQVMMTVRRRPSDIRYDFFSPFYSTNSSSSKPVRSISST